MLRRVIPIQRQPTGVFFILFFIFGANSKNNELIQSIM